MFNRLTAWLRSFMYGRYGVDAFTFFLLIVSMILSLIYSFLGRAGFLWILNIISMLILVFCVFRMLSRNIAKRQGENAKYLTIWFPIKKFFLGKTAKMRDTSHKYFKCPKCKQTVRVPIGRGKIQITCPKCHCQFVKKS